MSAESISRPELVEELPKATSSALLAIAMVIGTAVIAVGVAAGTGLFSGKTEVAEMLPADTQLYAVLDLKQLVSAELRSIIGTNLITETLEMVDSQQPDAFMSEVSGMMDGESPNLDALSILNWIGDELILAVPALPDFEELAAASGDMDMDEMMAGEHGLGGMEVALFLATEGDGPLEWIRANLTGMGESEVTISESSYREIPIFIGAMDEFHPVIVVLNDWLVLATEMSVAEAVVDRALDKPNDSLASNDDFKEYESGLEEGMLAHAFHGTGEAIDAEAIGSSMGLDASLAATLSSVSSGQSASWMYVYVEGGGIVARMVSKFGDADEALVESLSREPDGPSLVDNVPDNTVLFVESSISSELVGMIRVATEIEEVEGSERLLGLLEAGLGRVAVAITDDLFNQESPSGMGMVFAPSDTDVFGDMLAQLIQDEFGMEIVGAVDEGDGISTGRFGDEYSDNLIVLESTDVLNSISVASADEGLLRSGLDGQLSSNVLFQETIEQLGSDLLYLGYVDLGRALELYGTYAGTEFSSMLESPALEKMGVAVSLLQRLRSAAMGIEGFDSESMTRSVNFYLLVEPVE